MADQTEAGRIEGDRLRMHPSQQKLFDELSITPETLKRGESAREFLKWHATQHLKWKERCFSQLVPDDVDMVAWKTENFPRIYVSPDGETETVVLKDKPVAKFQLHADGAGWSFAILESSDTDGDGVTNEIQQPAMGKHNVSMDTKES